MGIAGERPNWITKVGDSRLRPVIQTLGVVGLLLSVGLVIQAMGDLPDRIAIHFNLKGEADGWGSKHVLWIIPGIAILIWALLSILERYPHTFNYPIAVTADNSARLYSTARLTLAMVKVETVWMFAWLTRDVIQVGKGEQESIAWIIVPVFVAVILLTAAASYWLSRSEPGAASEPD